MLMTAFTQSVQSMPGLLLAMAVVALMGPAGLVAALTARGWRPVREARRRWHRLQERIPARSTSR